MIEARGTDTSALSNSIVNVMKKKQEAKESLELEKAQKEREDKLANKVNDLFKKSKEQGDKDKERIKLQKGRIDKDLAEHASKLDKKKNNVMKAGDVREEVSNQNDAKIKSLEKQRAGSKINKAFNEAEELLKKLRGGK